MLGVVRGRELGRLADVHPGTDAAVHLAFFPQAPDGVLDRDGRLLRTERGGVILPSGYGRTWHKARALALTPDEQESSLVRRPYDLRQGVSLRLNAGVPAAQVSEWAAQCRGPAEDLRQGHRRAGPHVAGPHGRRPEGVVDRNANGTRTPAYGVPRWHRVSHAPETTTAGFHRSMVEIG